MKAKESSGEQPALKDEKDESWFWGYQEEYDSGYSEGYKKGFENGVHEGYRRGKVRMEFLAIKCSCGHKMLFPVFRGSFSSSFQIKEDWLYCPECGAPLSKAQVVEAYTKRWGHKPLEDRFRSE